jgi:hypothetical protein
MARKLKTKKGHAAYARRKAIVEPAFGQMMTVLNARQLRLRGPAAARAQWRFDCAIHNLLKLHRNGGLSLLASGYTAPGATRRASNDNGQQRYALRPPATASPAHSSRTGPPTTARPVSDPGS